MKICFIVFSLLVCLSCKNEKNSIAKAEEVIQRLVLKNASHNYYRYKNDEFGKNASNTVYPIMKTIKLELDTTNQLTKSKKVLISYLDSIEKEYIPNRIWQEDEYYRKAFDIKVKLNNGTMKRYEELEAIDKLMNFVLFQERDGSLYHYPYNIKLYFTDTIYLAKNHEYTFPMALFHDHKGNGKMMNILERDVNFEQKFVTINTFNLQSNIKKMEIPFKLYNYVTGQENSLKDEIVIKVLD